MMENSRLLFVYVIWGDLSQSGGIVKKFKQQAAACRTKGIPIDFLCINEDEQSSESNMTYQQVRFGNPFYRALILLFFKGIAVGNVLKKLNYKYVVLRYPGADLGVFNLFRSNYKVISEHHSIEINEYRTKLGTAYNLLSFQLKLNFLFNYIQELIFGQIYRAKVSGIIGVTTEIASHQQSRAKTRQLKLQTAISNGIQIADFEETRYTPFDGKVLNMVVSIGRLAPWHGIDRLIDSINHYSGDVIVMLHIISPAELPLIINSPHQINQYHDLSHQDQLTVFKRSTLAVSTLAFFRIGLAEGTPLKSREYMARGIPFVYGYEDEDVKKIDPDQLFTLQIPNKDEFIDVHNIVNFAARVSNNPDQISRQMRQKAEDYLSHASKMKQLYDFASRC